MKSIEIKTEGYRRLLGGFASWLEALGYSKGSRANLPSHAREFLGWLEESGRHTAAYVNMEDAKGFMAHAAARGNARRQGRPLSEAHLVKMAQALRLLSKYARQTGQGGFAMPPVPKRPRQGASSWLTRAEASALYDACGTDAAGLRDRAMLAVFYGCGLRRAEGEALDAADILLGAGLLRVRRGKGGRERYVPMAAGAMRDIAAYMEKARPLLLRGKGHAALFIGRHGGRLQSQGMARRLAKLAENAGLAGGCTLHTLRHSIATHLLASGMPMRQVGEFLGHATLEATQIYTHLESNGEKGGSAPTEGGGNG